MAEKTQKELTHELHQVVLGIGGTEDNGMVGDIREIKELCQEQNGRVRKNARLIYIMYGALATSGIGLGINFFIG